MRRIWIFLAGSLLLLVELGVLAARAGACEPGAPPPRLEAMLMLHDVRLLLELEAEIPAALPAERAVPRDKPGRSR